jgi:hypothetical protein
MNPVTGEAVVTGLRHFGNTRQNSTLRYPWINFVHLLFILLIWLALCVGKQSTESVSGVTSVSFGTDVVLRKSRKA